MCFINFLNHKNFFYREKYKRKINFTIALLSPLSLFLFPESVTVGCLQMPYVEINDRNQNDQVSAIRRGFTQ